VSLSKDEIERIIDIKKSLELTHKSSTNLEQRQRLKKQLDEITAIIEDINDGKWVNPLKIKLFSTKKNTDDNNIKKDTSQHEVHYDKVTIIKLTANSHDDEMDIVYSYFKFFDENFYHVLSLRNLKLRFDAGKKRDDILSSYDIIQRLFEQYIKDLNQSYQIGEKSKEQINLRNNTEKYGVLVRIQDFFQQLNLLVIEINKGLLQGEKIVLNPDEKYFNQHDITGCGIFEGLKIHEIFLEMGKFLTIFLSKISIPEFLKGKR